MLQRSGSTISSQAAGPKSAWIRQYEPQVWAQARRFYMAHNYVVVRLTGAQVLDHQPPANAFRCTTVTLTRGDAALVEDIAPGL